jgi:hypothetical protein
VFRRFSRTRWILSHTPVACQSRSRRQQVMPDPQPISCGRYSQGMPVRSTKRIPVKAWRSGTGVPGTPYKTLDRRGCGAPKGDIHEQVRVKRVADGFCGFFATSIRRCLEGTS